MKTLLEVLKLSSEYLAKHQIENSRRTAEEIFAHILRMKRLDLYLEFDRPLLEGELDQIRSAMRRCASQEPLEYILGEVEFLSCSFCIDSRVLIPRVETEVWTEKVAHLAKKGVLWDLCTGSGCIGISLKKKCPDLQVTLSDLSWEALQVAQENAKRNQVEVDLVQGDLLAPFEGKKADFIVCNPPYISKKEYKELSPSVRNFEPSLALVGGEDGLEIYRRLKKDLPKYLNKGGKLFLEIGATQGEEIQKIFPGCTVEKDFSSHPRFVQVFQTVD